MINRKPNALRTLGVALGIVSVLNTQSLATDAQCVQSIGMYRESFKQLKFVVENSLMSQVHLAGMNVVSDWEMAYKYCMNSQEGLTYLNTQSNLIRSIRSTM